MHKHIRIVAIIIAIFFTVKSDVLMWKLSLSFEYMFANQELITNSYENVNEDEFYSSTECGVVPEPTSAMLTMIGFGMMMLRRRK